MNITAPLRRLARLQPDATAVAAVPGTALTYAMLDRAIDAMAQRARGLGLRPGDIAGLAAGPDQEQAALVLMLALARIGVASAAASLPPGLARRWFHASGVSMPGATPFGTAWLADALADASVPPAPMHDDEDALCRIFASSGTTGAPKHIPVSHAVMTRRVHSRIVADGGGPRTLMVCVSPQGTFAFAAVLLTLWQGGKVVFADLPALPDALERFSVDSLLVSPASLQHVVNQRGTDAAPLPGLRDVIVGGAHLPTALRRQAEAGLCPRLICYLGMAEAGGIASAPFADLDDRPGATGIIWPDVTVQAVDDADQPLPAGEEGLLRVRGTGLAAGYLGAPAETAARFRDGWFYAGDIGTVWPDGMLTLGGRQSDLINLGGNKVNAAQIEQVLLRLPGVTDAAVFGVPNDAGLNEVCAALVAPRPVDEAALDAFCRQHLPAISLATVVELEALPRNANGKLERDRLTALVLDLNARDAAADG